MEDIMNMLDKCINEFAKLDEANEVEKEEFIYYTREAQKVLALVMVRKLDK